MNEGSYSCLLPAALLLLAACGGDGGAESSRWTKFGPARDEVLPSQPDKFVEWHTTRKGETRKGEEGEEAA